MRQVAHQNVIQSCYELIRNKKFAEAEKKLEDLTAYMRINVAERQYHYFVIMTILAAYSDNQEKYRLFYFKQYRQYTAKKAPEAETIMSQYGGKESHHEMIAEALKRYALRHVEKVDQAGITMESKRIIHKRISQAATDYIEHVPDANDPQIHFCVAQCAFFDASWDRAQEFAEKVIVKYPTDIKTLACLVQVYFEQGKFESSKIKAHALVLEIKNQRPREEAGVYAYLGAIHYQLAVKEREKEKVVEHIKKAVEYLNKALTIDADHALSHSYLAQIHLDQSETARAMEHAGMAAEAEEKSGHHDPYPFDLEVESIRAEMERQHRRPATRGSRKQKERNASRHAKALKRRAYLARQPRNPLSRPPYRPGDPRRKKPYCLSLQSLAAVALFSSSSGKGRVRVPPTPALSLNGITPATALTIQWLDK